MTTFSIVTLNCCLWPIGIRATINSALKDERCTIIPKILEKADIGLCQEVFTWKLLDNKWIAIMQKYLKKYDWIYDTSSSLINSGLWTITRFTILSQQFITFNHICIYSLSHPVGFLHTCMSISNIQVHIINVHMLSDEAICVGDVSLCFEGLYRKEMEQLVAYIETIDGNWIIGGDFNVNGDDLLIQWFVTQLKKRGKLSYFHPDVNTCNDTSYANHTSKYLKVDHFYTNMEMKDCHVLHENVSDHYPVMATFVLPNNLHSKFL